MVWFFGQNVHGPICEYLFVTENQYRYELMFGLHAYYKQREMSTDAMSFGVRTPPPEYSTINYLIYLRVSINFI